MIQGLSRTRRNVLLFVLAVLLAWFAWTIRSVLNPVLLGYLCAFVLAPFVRRIEERGFSRRTAVNLTFVGGFLLAGLVLLVLVLQVRSLAIEAYASARAEAAEEAAVEAIEEGREVPEQGELPPLTGGVEGRSRLELRLQRRVDEFFAILNGWGIEVASPEVDVSEVGELAGRFLQDVEGGAVDVAGRGVRFVQRFFGRLIGFFGLFFLLPLYAYYFLFVGKDVQEFVRRHLPKRQRGRVTRVAREIGDVVANFFRGRLGVCFVKGVLLSVGLFAVGVDYAFLFGMLSGFLSIVPFFGPFLGFLLAFAVGILEHGVLSSLVRTGSVFLVGELLEGYVLVPKILGDSLGLHPLVVFVALLAGGAAFGLLGVLLALPVTASAVILFKEFVLPPLRDWAEEDSPAGG